MVAPATNRWRYLCLLWAEGLIAKWIGAAWTLVGVVIFLRDDIFKAEWKIITIIPHLSTWEWSTVWLVIAVLWIFESSFKIARRKALQIAELNDKLRSSLSVTWETESAIEALPNGVVRLLLFVTVENQGQARQTSCRVRLRCQKTGTPTRRSAELHGWQDCCAPFDLLVDDRKPVPVLYKPDPFNDPDPEYLNTMSFSQRGGEWAESTTALLIPKTDPHDIWIEAMSAESRRTVIRLKLWFEQSWQIRVVDEA